MSVYLKIILKKHITPAQITRNYDTNCQASLTCWNRQIHLMPGTPSCRKDSWGIAMTTKCDWGHILLVVCCDGKVVWTQALSDCGRANDWRLHWVNSFQLHANFKSMNSRLEMLLSLNAKAINEWIKKNKFTASITQIVYNSEISLKRCKKTFHIDDSLDNSIVSEGYIHRLLPSYM